LFESRESHTTIAVAREISHRLWQASVLRSDCPAEWNDLLDVLSGFRFSKSNILKPGGGKSLSRSPSTACSPSADGKTDTSSVGVVITRADEVQAIFNELGRVKSFGQATTHMSKLLPKVTGGGAGGCPVLAFGITRELYDPDS
jgi:hypothetical protein